MSEEDDYHKVCSELDDLAIRILELMEEIVKARVPLNNSLKSGFVNLAKSRYINGCNSVSMLQVTDADIKPLHKVTREEQDSSVSDTKFQSFQVINTEESDDSEDASSSVHHRKRCPDGGDLSSGIGNLHLGDDSKKERLKSPGRRNDPLKWFGVLVPQSLRASQTRFNEAVETTAIVASLQNELLCMCDKYQHLIMRKTALANSVKSKGEKVSLQQKK